MLKTNQMDYNNGKYSKNFDAVMSKTVCTGCMFRKTCEFKDLIIDNLCVIHTEEISYVTQGRLSLSEPSLQNIGKNDFQYRFKTEGCKSEKCKHCGNRSKSIFPNRLFTCGCEEFKTWGNNKTGRKSCSKPNLSAKGGSSEI